MFSVMLNVAMRAGGCIMGQQHALRTVHRSRSWGQSLVVSSVFQWQRLSTDPLLQAVGDGQSLGAGSKPESLAPSCGQTVFWPLSALLSGGKSGLDRTPR